MKKGLQTQENWPFSKSTQVALCLQGLSAQASRYWQLVPEKFSGQMQSYFVVFKVISPKVRMLCSGRSWHVAPFLQGCMAVH